MNVFPNVGSTDKEQPVLTSKFKGCMGCFVVELSETNPEGKVAYCSPVLFKSGSSPALSCKNECRLLKK